MQEQDKRAVESMCRCGLDLKSVISIFPKLPGAEIAAIYKSVNDMNTQTDGECGISINCS